MIVTSAAARVSKPVAGAPDGTPRHHSHDFRQWPGLNTRTQSAQKLDASRRSHARAQRDCYGPSNRQSWIMRDRSESRSIDGKPSR